MSRKVFAIAVISTFASAALAAISCSEATDGVTPPAAVGQPGAEAGPGSDGSANPVGDATDRPDPPVITASDVLLNEISASGEWIELVSAGNAAVDISGFRVADLSKDGGPKLSESVKFPAGTILSPKAYALVQGGGLDGGGKPCPDGGQSYCFNAEFGISNKNGETLYLIDTTGTVVGTAVYPPAAADAGESWARLPSGDPTGTFQNTVPTPGAPNKSK